MGEPVPVSFHRPPYRPSPEAGVSGQYTLVAQMVEPPADMGVPPVRFRPREIKKLQVVSETAPCLGEWVVIGPRGAPKATELTLERQPLCAGT